MQPIRIFPEYAMILKYDVKPGTLDGYYQYVMQDFVPTLQRRKIYMQNAYEVVYGKYPQRHIEFVVEHLTTIKELLEDPKWENMETRLQTYAENYSRSVIPYRGTFKL